MAFKHLQLNMFQVKRIFPPLPVYSPLFPISELTLFTLSIKLLLLGVIPNLLLCSDAHNLTSEVSLTVTSPSLLTNLI